MNSHPRHRSKTWLETIAPLDRPRTVLSMKNKAVHRTPDLDPSVVEKILARHEGELSDPVVYRPDRPLESKDSKEGTPAFDRMIALRSVSESLNSQLKNQHNPHRRAPAVGHPRM